MERKGMIINKMKTAVFGGSFNPIHCGHIGLVREISSQLLLDRVIVMPTFISPFKKKSAEFVASGEDRINMCRLAFEKMNNVEVSDYELKIGGVSYSVNTVKYLKNIYPNDELYFIMGGDMLMSLDKWYEFETLMSLCTIVAASREKDGTDYDELVKKAAALGIFGRVVVAKISTFEASSTMIREKIQKNQDIACYMPKNVVKYISDVGLYV